MKKVLLTLALCFAIKFNATDKVKFVNNKKDADITIFVTFNRREADKIVFLTDKTHYRQRGVWQTVNNRLEADYTVFETVFRRDADIIVFFTDNINEVTK